MNLDAYVLVIAASLIVILSYFFNVISKKTNVPSVLLLIVLGILIKQGGKYIGLDIPEMNTLLEALGAIGLILIVLEAALDLELTREKWPLIWKSFTVAFASLIISTGAIALVFYNFVFEGEGAALSSVIYAIPLSVMSSAIIIPSVGGLRKDRKEFMVYEGTFSDILGIMFFYFVTGNQDETAGNIILNVSINIIATLLLSFVACYIIIFIFQRIKSQVKLFLIIAILTLLYAVGKKIHLSSLILILIFGLMLNNYKLFFRGRLRKFIDDGVLIRILQDFHLLTLESAFVIRTFFFVIFGVTITLASIFNWEVVFYSMVFTTMLYVIRLVFLLIFQKENVFPLLYIAPRGLITILLFFGIPAELATDEFEPGILLFMIITTNIIMTISLIQTGLEIKPVLTDHQPSSSKKQNGKQNGDNSGKLEKGGNGDKKPGSQSEPGNQNGSNQQQS
ncbi:cation:proton antiporter domain-containing protein [Halocola ammonii]